MRLHVLNESRLHCKNKREWHWEPLNTLGIVAGQAAYEEAEEWLQQVIAYIDGTMDYVERFIGSNIPLINFVKPQGTYLAWLDVNSVIGKIGAKEIATKANTGRDPLIPSITPEMIVERYFSRTCEGTNQRRIPVRLR